MKMLLYMTLGGSALALLLLALRYVFLRRMPSTVYYYAWLLVLLRFALPLPGLIPTEKRQSESDAVTQIYTAVPFEEEGAEYTFIMPGKPDAGKTAAPMGTEAEQPEPAPAVVNPAVPHVSRSFDWSSPVRCSALPSPYARISPSRGSCGKRFEGLTPSPVRSTPRFRARSRLCGVTARSGRR